MCRRLVFRRREEIHSAEGLRELRPGQSRLAPDLCHPC